MIKFPSDAYWKITLAMSADSLAHTSHNRNVVTLDVLLTLFSYEWVGMSRDRKWIISAPFNCFGQCATHSIMARLPGRTVSMTATTTWSVVILTRFILGRHLYRHSLDFVEGSLLSGLKFAYYFLYKLKLVWSGQLVSLTATEDLTIACVSIWTSDSPKWWKDCCLTTFLCFYQRSLRLAWSQKLNRIGPSWLWMGNQTIALQRQTIAKSLYSSLALKTSWAVTRNWLWFDGAFHYHQWVGHGSLMLRTPLIQLSLFSSSGPLRVKWLWLSSKGSTKS